jgi:hypothetical protein
MIILRPISLRHTAFALSFDVFDGMSLTSGLGYWDLSQGQVNKPGPGTYCLGLNNTNVAFLSSHTQKGCRYISTSKIGALHQILFGDPNVNS